MPNNNFDFDDDFSFDNDTDDSGGSNFVTGGSSALDFDEEDDGFEDLGGGNLEDKKATRKVAMVAIVCGVLLIVLIFAIVNFVNGISDRKSNSSVVNNQTTQVESSKPSKNNKDKDNQNTPVQPNTQTNNQSSSGWLEFESAEGLIIDNKYMDSTFSVTSIKHYVKVIDSVNIEIKTVLNGALAGFTGTYEMEVPYSKGSKLSIGDSFIVQVQIGSTSDGKNVIGEIKY